MAAKQKNVTIYSGFLVALGITIGMIGSNYITIMSDSSANQIKQHATPSSTSANQSILTTNYDSHLQPQDEVRDISVSIPIYDVGYVVYSKKFAERFGYPEKYIANLDPGMQALEFRMSTRGGDLRCHLNTLLDNALGLDFPSEEYVNRFERHGDMIRFPQKIDGWKDPKGLNGYRELPEDQEFRLNVTQYKWYYYSRNIRLANYDYAVDPSTALGIAAGSWSASQSLDGYSKRYFKGLDYVSVSTTCGRLAHQLLLKDKLSIWFKKKGGADYTKLAKPNPSEFFKFRIPADFARKAAKVMEPSTNYMFIETLKSQP